MPMTIFITMVAYIYRSFQLNVAICIVKSGYIVMMSSACRLLCECIVTKGLKLESCGFHIKVAKCLNFELGEFNDEIRIESSPTMVGAFYRATQLCYSYRGIGDRNSVRPSSVPPSVRPSHACFVTKRKNIVQHTAYILTPYERAITFVF